MKRRSLFWNFVQSGEDTTSIYLYDEIAKEKSDVWTGERWEKGSEVSALEFKGQLDQVSTPNILVRINSAGGDVFEASAMAQAIREAGQRHTITAQVDGVCASAAMTVALACQSVAIPPNAYMMIHQAKQVLCGTYSKGECRQAADALTVMDQGLARAYMDKTGLSQEEIAGMMDAETWMDGARAVELGFADRLLGAPIPMDVREDTVHNLVRVNGAMVALGDFDKAPQALRTLKQPMTQGEDDMKFENSAQMKEAYPTFVDELTAQAVAQAVAQERKRMQELDEVSGCIPGELLAKAKYETGERAETVVMATIRSGQMTNTGYLAALAQDAAEGNQVGSHANPGAQGQQMTPQQLERVQVENAAKSVWLALNGK